MIVINIVLRCIYFMKRFIKKNTIISILGLVSILITVSYAITYNMPDYFGIESWYSLFNNISISYIAALIFYVLQVYKPELENSKKAQVMLMPLFSDLIQFIEVSIACCRKYVSIDEHGTVVIEWHDTDPKAIYFVPETAGSAKRTHRPAVRKTGVDIEGLEAVYKSKIKDIKERIYFRDCDPDILNALSKLESSSFFKSTVIPALRLEGSFVSFSDFQTHVNDFETLKDEFKKHCGITCKYEVRDAESIEIAACKAIYQRQALQAKSVDDFTETTFREYLKLQLRPHIADETQLNETVDATLSEIMKNMKSKM